MEILSSDGSSTIVPRSVIGAGEPSGFLISGGQIIYGYGSNMTTFYSLSELRQLTPDDLVNSTIDDIKEDTYLELEPGKCYVLRVFAMSRGHHMSDVTRRTTCYKRLYSYTCICNTA